jgi:putative ABC transport system permease protein
VDSAFFRIYGITVEPTGIPPTKETWWLSKKAYKAVHADPATQTFRVWGGEEKAQIPGIFNDFKIRTLERDYNLLRIRWRRSYETPWVIIVKMMSGTDYYGTAKRIEREYTQYTGENCSKPGL